MNCFQEGIAKDTYYVGSNENSRILNCCKLIDFTTLNPLVLNHFVQDLEARGLRVIVL